jgi:hypothetical protein
MTDTIRKVEYFYVTTLDKPGEGHRVLSWLGQAGVNLLAYLGFPSGRGRAQLDFVPEDPKAFKVAARNLGLKPTGPRKAFLVQGYDRPGAVAETVDKLSRGKINVTAAQAVTDGSGRWAMLLWVKPKDVNKASKLLGV